MADSMTLLERVARAMASANYPGASDADIDEMWEGWVMEAGVAIREIENAAKERPT